MPTRPKGNRPRNYRTTMRAFTARLKARRLELGLTQEEVAERLGTIPRHYQKIEAGELNITLVTLCRVALALGVAPVDLLR